MANHNTPTAKANILTIEDKDIAIWVRELAGMDLYEVRASVSPQGKAQWTYLTADSINKDSKDVTYEFDLVKVTINKALAALFGKDGGDVPKTVLEQIEKLISELTVEGTQLK